METVHDAFQAYMTCINTTWNQISIGSNTDFVKKDSENIKNACAETLNYDIPKELKSELIYFVRLQEKLKILPIQDDLASKFTALLTFPLRAIVETAATNEEERTCFDNKVSSYSASLGLDNDSYKSLSPKEKEDLDNQLEAALKVFLKECRREAGEKAYQDIKQNFKCDSINSTTK